MELAVNRDPMTIHVIEYNEDSFDKAIICQLLTIERIAHQIPPYSKPKDIFNAIFHLEERLSYFLDIPKHIKRDKLDFLYENIERIKDGYAYTWKPKFQQQIRNSPNVFVFTHEIPNFPFLRRNKWKLWSVKQGQLVPYEKILSVSPAKPTPIKIIPGRIN